LLFALTSYATFEMLRSGRSREEVQAVITSTCHRCLFAPRTTASAAIFIPAPPADSR
jgi:hypothetical protein